MLLISLVVAMREGVKGEGRRGEGVSGEEARKELKKQVNSYKS